MSAILSEQAPVKSQAPDLEAMLAVRKARRGSNAIRRLHHHAIRTNDMEATRHFYEDLIGLPLVSSYKEMVDPTTGSPTPYLHCFFEMGDGSCMAFFAFSGGARGEAPLMPQDAFDHHIAVSAGSFADFEKVRNRLLEANYPTCGIDHGFCYSLYVRDPNNMLFEIVADPANELEMNERYAAEAHGELERWNRAEYSANNLERGNMDYPWPSSSIEEMNKVLPPQRS